MRNDVSALCGTLIGIAHSLSLSWDVHKDGFPPLFYFKYPTALGYSDGPLADLRLIRLVTHGGGTSLIHVWLLNNGVGLWKARNPPSDHTAITSGSQQREFVRGGIPSRLRRLDFQADVQRLRQG